MLKVSQEVQLTKVIGLFLYLQHKKQRGVLHDEIYEILALPEEFILKQILCLKTQKLIIYSPRLV